MRVITPEEIYRRWSAQYNADIKTMEWTAQDHIFNAVHKSLHNGITIFEAGCGTGALARKFTHANDTICVKGVDVSAEMIEISEKDPRNTNIEITQLDLESGIVPLPDESVEIAISCGVFEYIEDISNVCSEISRLLKRNGIVAIAYENDSDDPPDRRLNLVSSNRSGIDENGNVIEGALFYYHHGRDILETRFKNAGFHILQHYNFVSTVIDGRNVCYNLLSAVKAPADEFTL